MNPTSTGKLLTTRFRDKCFIMSSGLCTLASLKPLPRAIVHPCKCNDHPGVQGSSWMVENDDLREAPPTSRVKTNNTLPLTTCDNHKLYHITYYGDTATKSSANVIRSCIFDWIYIYIYSARARARVCVCVNQYRIPPK